MVGFSIEDRGATHMVYVLADNLAGLSRLEADGKTCCFDYTLPCFHENGDSVKLSAVLLGRKGSAGGAVLNFSIVVLFVQFGRFLQSILVRFHCFYGIFY